MKESEILERLIDCGLDEKEARSYLTLLIGGVAKASEVAKRAGFSRMDAYNSLNKLQNRGLVEATMEKPMKFVPRPIEEALGILIKEREMDIQKINETKDDLSQYIKLSKVETEIELRFRILKERKNIHLHIESMVENAEEEVLLMLTQEGLIRAKASGIFATLAKLQKEGRKVRVMTQMNQLNLKQSKLLAKEHDLRHFELPSFSFLIIDNDEVLLSIALDDRRGSSGTEDTALWMNSPDFIKAQRQFFEQLWQFSTSAQDRITELETGYVVKPLEFHLGNGSMYQKLREILKTREAQRKAGEPITVNYSLENFGIESPALLRVVGNRIGEEISNQIESDEAPALWEEMVELWKELDMGELEVKGEDLNKVTFAIDNADNCYPEVEGTLLCHLDKGILEGIVGTKLGLNCEFEKQSCKATGEEFCRYEINAKLL